MSYALDVLTSMRNSLRTAGLNAEVAKPRTELERPYIVLNILPVSINESSLSGGTQIIDLYVTVTAVGANQDQSEAAMKRALHVIESVWTEPALLGPPEHSPGAHLPQEEGTWRCDSTVKLRMQ
jgi:hypothetical protein